MRNQKQFAVILLIAIAILNCCNKDDPDTRPEFVLHQYNNIHEEEYKIYSLVLDNYFSVTDIVIEQKTSADIFLTYQDPYTNQLHTNNPGIESTLIDNYVQINDSSYYLDNKFICNKVKLRLITSEELNYIFSGYDINDSWNEFYKEYPNSAGIITLTRIGFNHSYTQAIFEIGFMYASLAGFGSIVYLEKEDNIWIIKDRISSWLS